MTDDLFIKSYLQLCMSMNRDSICDLLNDINNFTNTQSIDGIANKYNLDVSNILDIFYLHNKFGNSKLINTTNMLFGGSNTTANAISNTNINNASKKLSLSDKINSFANKAQNVINKAQDIHTKVTQVVTQANEHINKINSLTSNSDFMKILQNTLINVFQNREAINNDITQLKINMTNASDELINKKIDELKEIIIKNFNILIDQIRQYIINKKNTTDATNTTNTDMTKIDQHTVQDILKKFNKPLTDVFSNLMVLIMLIFSFK